MRESFKLNFFFFLNKALNATQTLLDFEGDAFEKHFKKCNLKTKNPKCGELYPECEVCIAVVEHYLLFFSANKFSALFTLSLFAAPLFSLIFFPCAEHVFRAEKFA